jgi:uncharacterized membrane protein
MQDAGPQSHTDGSRLVRDVLFARSIMQAEHIDPPFTSVSNANNLIAVGTGAALLAYGAMRRSPAAAWIAAASVPFLYRGFVGHWPEPWRALAPNGDTKTALSGDRGVHVREAVRLELPIHQVYSFWRRLENLPRFMRYLDSVREDATGRSHWIALGPRGVRIEWDAELINEVEDQVIAWRSLPGSDVTTAGSVNFDAVRGGRGTQVTVNLQYAPPAGKTGAWVAALFGREPSQTIREDLRRLKQVLEAGEIALATLP